MQWGITIGYQSDNNLPALRPGIRLSRSRYFVRTTQGIWTDSRGWPKTLPPERSSGQTSEVRTPPTAYKHFATHAITSANHVYVNNNTWFEIISYILAPGYAETRDECLCNDWITYMCTFMLQRLRTWRKWCGQNVTPIGYANCFIFFSVYLKQKIKYSKWVVLLLTVTAHGHTCSPAV